MDTTILLSGEHCDTPLINTELAKSLWASVPETSEFEVDVWNSLLFMAVMYAERYGVEFNDKQLPYASEMQVN